MGVAALLHVCPVTFPPPENKPSKQQRRVQEAGYELVLLL
jgi:hypothetical protein